MGHTRLSGTVLIPAFKEEANVAESLAKIASVLIAELGELEWDFVVVDDGSPDATSAEVERVAPTLGVPIMLVRHRRNQGLGGALRTGLARTTGDVVVVMDCDLTYAPSTIVDLVREWLHSRAHVVVASPYGPGGSTVAVPPALARRSRIANAILSRSAQGSVATLTGMVRAYDGPFIRSLPIKAVGPDVNVEIIYKAETARANIVEVPAVLDWTGRGDRFRRSALASNSSRWTTYKSLVMSYLFRPFAFPLALFALVAGVGAVFLVRGDIEHALMMLGMAVLYLLHALAMLQAKRYYEELFTQLGGLSGRRHPVADHPNIAQTFTFSPCSKDGNDPNG